MTVEVGDAVEAPGARRDLNVTAGAGAKAFVGAGEGQPFVQQHIAEFRCAAVQPADEPEAAREDLGGVVLLLAQFVEDGAECVEGVLNGGAEDLVLWSGSGCRTSPFRRPRPG